MACVPILMTLLFSFFFSFKPLNETGTSLCWSYVFIFNKADPVETIYGTLKVQTSL